MRPKGKSLWILRINRPFSSFPQTLIQIEFEYEIFVMAISSSFNMNENWYRGINSFSFLCWMLCIMGQKVSTKSLMAILSDCFTSSSCLLYENIANNTNIHIKETKKCLPYKTWWSLSVPRSTALPQRKLKLLMLVLITKNSEIVYSLCGSFPCLWPTVRWIMGIVAHYFTL